jgi:hypothetical protein
VKYCSYQKGQALGAKVGRTKVNDEVVEMASMDRVAKGLGDLVMQVQGAGNMVNQNQATCHS